MYKIYFKTKDKAIACECNNIRYSYKDNCIHLNDGDTLYKSFFTEDDINSIFNTLIKNGYISFSDRIFSLDA